MITKGNTSILPHQNWRGQFGRGTYADGRSSDCPEATSPNCTPIPWPGHRTTAWHADVKEPDIRVWWGGLVDDIRDASGQQYKRNRYYDPATGQFTQPDPIGIAGGLNSYGFGAGDPVSYSDPYGLKVVLENDEAVRVWNALRREITRGLNSRDAAEREAANTLRTVINGVISDTDNTWRIKIGGLGRAVGHFTDRAGGALTIMEGSTLRDARTTMRSGNLWNLNPVISLAHELGHAGAIMRGDAPALAGLPTENAARLLMGCTRGRVLEYSPPPGCN